MGNYGWGEFGTNVHVSHNDDKQHDDLFGIDSFYIKKGFSSCEDDGFEFKAPTTRRNASRVLRAMQLPKPDLYSFGSPGRDPGLSRRKMKGKLLYMEKQRRSVVRRKVMIAMNPMMMDFPSSRSPSPSKLSGSWLTV